MTLDEKIKYWKSRFRILRYWKIVYKNDGEHYGQCTHTKHRKAFIRPYAKSGRMPKDYIFHEILHICQAEIRLAKKPGTIRWSSTECEEKFVQDLCQILKKDLNSKGAING